ncbi:MAG: TonB-dependent receptor plug domain-containing protein [Deltaproteobacteria bacterium]|nr:TonB-dependent receptor plug domain-containing protein [Deltaproteobacteria bacterium]
MTFLRRQQRRPRGLVLALIGALLVSLGLPQIGESSTPPNPVTRLGELTVTRRRPTTAASSETIRARDYEMRPHTTTQEILNNVPGLVVAQHQGGGKATQYFLRGFDADHGTDVVVFVDGVPVNMVSHAHGQGYADLNFLIPETVQRIELYKGPYFVEYGDLANAGAINIVTKDDVVENSFQALGGYFNTTRYSVAASPHFGPVKSLLAAEVYHSDGPFINPQRYGRYNLFSKFTWEPTPESKLSFWASNYGGDWHGSGQIPLREIHAGRLNRFGAIDPSEGGRTDRQNLNLIYTYTPSTQESWFVQLYGSRYKLNLFNNFTFFANDPVRGDGINQNDQRYLYVGTGNKSSSSPSGPVCKSGSVGTSSSSMSGTGYLPPQQTRFTSMVSPMMALSTLKLTSLFLPSTKSIPCGGTPSSILTSGWAITPTTPVMRSRLRPAVRPAAGGSTSKLAIRSSTGSTPTSTSPLPTPIFVQERQRPSRSRPRCS